MRKARFVFFIIVLLMLSAGAVTRMRSQAAGSPVTIWTADSLTKIRPYDAPGSETSVTLKAARNEFESFQIVVTAGSEDLNGIDIKVSNLISSRGRISKKNINIYKEAFINVNEVSNLAGQTGEWPDALIPKVDSYVHEKRNAFPFSVAAGRNQPIWLEVYVPSDAIAGDYQGKVTITGPGIKQVVDVTLTVWDFTIPATSSLKTAFSAGSADGLAKGHFGTTEVTDNEKLKLMKIYTLAELQHRLSNESCTYPYPYYDNEKIDWANFDKDWGPFLDGTALPNGARLTSIRISDQWGNDENFYRQYAEHFQQRGWLDRLFHYTADEPTTDKFESITQKASLLHKANEKLRVLVTTRFNDELANSVNIWTPVINYVDNKEGLGEARINHRPEYDAAIAAGNELWWYQSCYSHGCGISITDNDTLNNYFTNWPSYMIDLPAIYSRSMQWLSWRYRVTGELYYSTTIAYTFDGDPWNNLFHFGGNGDGTLFYPGTPERIGGKTDIPVESIRLKLIRDGLEDYEYFKLLAERGQNQFVDSEVEKLTPTTYNWNQDPAQMLNTRLMFGERLNSLSR